ncbi:MAG: M1 family metallopeptidase [Sphingobacteriales bacterium JAD_PAG50586_3]|nr:MAG: M1 family metallopeptidase [Sphingobacteriales bacterium JAD_PAG50586_3]
MKRFFLAATATAILLGQACKTPEKTTRNPEPAVDTAAVDNAQLDSLLKSLFSNMGKEDDADEKAADPVPALYQAAAKRVNDLIHTKLEVKFDFNTSQLMGKATLTFKPYFYPVTELVLDAKSMDINEVSLIDSKTKAKTKLPFEYKNNKLTVKLGRTFTRDEQYMVYVDYTANPDKVEQSGSEAITDAKGLYFIDPKGTDPNKPTQIWTQGETESSSCWFPTIDSPNEKTTQEIYITVDKKYITLSNGKMVSQKDNGDGTRTDYWKQDLPHSPYLFMMAVGDFAIVKDKWRGKEVNYYVEKDYEPYARQIFGNTPQMLDFFSNKLGVEYPWDKYSQIVVRDYVSGAMENTTSTIHGEFLQRNDRELLDETNEGIIAHELFHHWFGDLVTAESWSNLPLNESFANYSEYLWLEHKYGRDDADDHQLDDLNNYLSEADGGKNVDLIRFDYTAREDMFDRHSYDKGGRVLHMLRKYVGDDAFFSSLKDYLTTNKFQSAEIHNLRLSFEKVTGEDLNWFFNQWFMDKGHPELEVNYDYAGGDAIVSVTQKQNFKIAPLYKLPVDVDVYVGGKATRHRVWVDSVQNTFRFAVPTKPDLIVFDAEHQILGKIQDNKSNDDLVYQFEHAPLYYDRWEAIDRLAKKAKTPQAVKVLKAGLDDKFHVLRNIALIHIKKIPSSEFAGLKDKIIGMAKNDPKSQVRSAAISALTKMFEGDASLLPVYQDRLTNDKSYMVIGSALKAVAEVDKKAALTEAKKLENEKSGDILGTIAELYADDAKPEHYDFFIKSYPKVSSAMGKYSFITQFGNYIAKQDDDAVIDKGIAFAENIIKTENAWWLKLAGYSMINGAGGHYIEKIDKLKNEGAPENKIKEAEDRKDKIIGIFRENFKNEKDPQVLKYLGGGE